MQRPNLIAVYWGVFRYLYMRHLHSGVFQLHSDVFWCIPVYFGIYTDRAYVGLGCVDR